MFLDAVLKFCSDAGGAERDQRDKSDEFRENLKREQVSQKDRTEQKYHSCRRRPEFVPSSAFQIRHIFIF